MPADPPVAVPGARAGRSRRATALVVAAALVAVGGIGYAVVHGGGSGTKAGPAATPWTSPTPTATKAFGAESGGSHYGSLDLLLLPMPAKYEPGPDVNAYGNDVVLDAKQAQVLMRGDVTGLSKKERDLVDTDIADLRVVGAGLRTYTSDDGDLVVQMALVQMQNKAAASAGPAYFKALTKTLNDLRSGPKILGHPKAACALPKTNDGQLDVMVCEATEGDLMVTMTVTGTAPLLQDPAAELLSKQLDRIQDPGEAV